MCLSDAKRTSQMPRTSAGLLLAALALAGGCHPDQPAEGPAERAGKSVDQAAEDTKEGAKKAGDKIEQKSDEAEQKLKE